MKKFIISITAIVALIIVGAVVYVGNKPEETNTVVASQPEKKPPTTDEILTLVNVERAKAGVAPLVMDQRLNQSSERKTLEMIAENRYEHVNLAGVHGYEYAHEVAPECTTVGENLTGAESSDDALLKWLASPKHKEALLDSKYSSTGLSVQKAPNWYIVVQQFCAK